jgi:hypothetical protein
MNDLRSVKKVIIVSKYPNGYSSDSIRYNVTCEYSYDRLGHPKYAFTLIGDDALRGIIELLEAFDMIKNIQIRQLENNYNFYKGVFEPSGRQA